ncbi:hypothetical protein SAMD00019534_019450 [Acytostelium subglobosum LB1]|uniref:hypothetical protein n=1 Tax=Acytostelium subglobosum LB1 TaxID=1410327 RepID=UPI00064503E6|nr:hypothetical protein SAMD00019534_019450 [Acytostelium subglobosum LB1]GAM18770.1 hypothetical protein SAMD00019534_019450 [Acytostelium subglobosum LB1]|eukprot:XP_012757990.1 hypothetical protein SAMD00019534_019450 [Acytostelium subglobosum LB1]
MNHLGKRDTLLELSGVVCKQNFFSSFTNPCSIEFELDNCQNRKTIQVTSEKSKTEKLFVFVGNEPVSGKVHINLKDKSKKLQHQGIKVEFVGQIELFYDRGNHYEFTSLVRELAPAGELVENKTFTFDFMNVEKQYESYNGTNARLRYMVRLSIARNYAPNLTKENDIWVINFNKPPEVNSNIKMEVGIEDCLHIEFEYNKSKYHLKDVIIGKIYFLLVRIKIKTIHNKFSVKYFLNLALVDEDDKKYFKQQEITLWRRGVSKPLQTNNNQSKIEAPPTQEVPEPETSGDESD